MVQIVIKRIYDESSMDDGYRVLVDRLWPRGVSKEKAKLDEWVKDLAPSNELREWFHEDIDSRWNEFTKKYIQELEKNPEVPIFISHIKSMKKVTLLYAIHNEENNNALILKKYLDQNINV